MELTTMSEKELDRALVLRNVLDGGLSKVKAAATLGLSERQVRRLITKLQDKGPCGLISSNRIIPAIALAAHAAHNVILAKQFLRVILGILAAAIGMQ